MSALLGVVLATSNAAASEHQNTVEHLPFNYVPTRWFGILFIVLFALTTARHYFRHYFLVELGVTGDTITTTIIAPSFMTAAMFLVLLKIINELGTMYSRMPPRLLIQTAGGAMASFADTPDGAERSGKIMLGGIVTQLAAVILYTILGIEFAIRFSYDRPVRSKIVREIPKSTGWLGLPRRIVLMHTGLGIATVFIIIRSIYRTIELTDGWNGTVTSTEKWINWFDGAPIFMTMFAFNVFYPGHLLRNLESENRLAVSTSSSSDNLEMTRV
ncbi:unnamed protein product [Rhizoctonia solani]|uniref:Uncharacterized protein n=1 Tax=Rhizoctonia solani TaxID=456999 RepID=A0A8H3C6T1_9AGAM|nr:unnamed protein product [Rhizoctonia solani]